MRYKRLCHFNGDCGRGQLCDVDKYPNLCYSYSNNIRHKMHQAVLKTGFFTTREIEASCQHDIFIFCILITLSCSLLLGESNIYSPTQSTRKVTVTLWAVKPKQVKDAKMLKSKNALVKVTHPLFMSFPQLLGKRTVAMQSTKRLWWNGSTRSPTEIWLVKQKYNKMSSKQVWAKKEFWINKNNKQQNKIPTFTVATMQHDCVGCVAAYWLLALK